MSDFILIAYYLHLLGAFGFPLYVLFSRLIELIQQKHAEDMRKAYQSRKATAERQARQRL